MKTKHNLIDILPKHCHIYLFFGGGSTDFFYLTDNICRQEHGNLTSSVFQTI